MTEVRLDRPGVGPLVCQGEPARVAQGVRDTQGSPAAAPARSITLRTLSVVMLAPRSVLNTQGDPSAPLRSARNARSSRPVSGCVDGGAVLAPGDVEEGSLEVHLRPRESHQFGDSQAVPIREQDQRRVALAIAPSVARPSSAELEPPPRSGASGLRRALAR